MKIKFITALFVFSVISCDLQYTRGADPGAVANQPSQKAEPLNQEASPHREVVKKGDLQQPHPVKNGKGYCLWFKDKNNNRHCAVSKTIPSESKLIYQKCLTKEEYDKICQM